MDLARLSSAQISEETQRATIQQRRDVGGGLQRRQSVVDPSGRATLNDGIAQIDAIRRRKTTDPSVVLFLQDAKATLEGLPVAKTALLRELDAECRSRNELATALVLGLANKFCLDRALQRDGDIVRRQVGASMLQADCEMVKVLVDAHAFDNALRETIMRKPGPVRAEIQRNRAVVQRFLKSSRNLETHDPIAHARELCDQLGSYFMSFGQATKPHHFVDRPTEQLFAATYRLAIEQFGQHVLDEVKRYRNGRAPTSVSEDDFSVLDTVRIARYKTEANRRELAFRREPSLAHWKALTTHAEMSFGVVGSIYRSTAAKTAIFLDPSTHTFAQSMHLIQAYQQSMVRADQRIQARAAQLIAGDRAAKTDRTRKQSRHTAKNAADGVSPKEEAESNVVAASEISRRVKESLASQYAPVLFEGAVAKHVLDNLSIFSEIVGFNQHFRAGNGREIGEIDLHLDNAIIECTLADGIKVGNKNAQLNKYLTNDAMNPLGKAVVLYGPNYSASVPSRVHLVKNEEELATVLFSLKANSLGWVQQPSSLTSRAHAPSPKKLFYGSCALTSTLN